MDLAGLFVVLIRGLLFGFGYWLYVCNCVVGACCELLLIYML